MIQRELRASGVGARYARASIAGFSAPTKALAAARDRAVQYIEHYEEISASGLGLYISGPTGTGKTFLAAAIVHALIGRGFDHIVFVSSYDLLDGIRTAYGSDSGASADDVTRSYKTARLLVIDDIGKERLTEWGMTVLSSIVHARDAEMRPTIYTSNFALDDIGTALARGGDIDRAYAIASRIAGSTLYVPVIGEDCRRGKIT